LLEKTAIGSRKVQLFAATHASFRQIGETPVGKILKSALKNGQTDKGQNVCSERGSDHVNSVMQSIPSIDIYEDGLVVVFNGFWQHAIVYVARPRA
jgi:hypothetical protein